MDLNISYPHVLLIDVRQDLTDCCKKQNAWLGSPSVQSNQALLKTIGISKTSF